MVEVKTKSAVLPQKYGGGPLGLGDPEDKSLRKVETDVLIPKRMRDIANKEKCVEEVQKFTECCQNSSLLMVVSCRSENEALKSCLTKWYHDEDFKKRCQDEYLQDRSVFRRTGSSKKQENSRLPTSM